MTDSRIPATKLALQQRVLDAAHAAGATSLGLEEVIIVDVGDWSATFARLGATPAKLALTVLPRIRAMFCLVD